MAYEELFSSAQLCELAGCSFRQLDYWCRNRTLPAARGARGQGTQRAFTREQVVVARALRTLAEMGAKGPTLRQAAYRLLYGREEWARFAIVARDGRVRHVRGPDDLVGGWIVDLGACRRRVDLQLQLAG